MKIKQRKETQKSGSGSGRGSESGNGSRSRSLEAKRRRRTRNEREKLKEEVFPEGRTSKKLSVLFGKKSEEDSKLGRLIHMRSVN